MTSTATRRRKSSSNSQHRSVPDHTSLNHTRNLTRTQQHTSGNEQAEKDAGKETDEKLKEIKSIGDKEGHTVVENLLRAVTDVKPQVPDRVEQPVA